MIHNLGDDDNHETDDPDFWEDGETEGRSMNTATLEAARKDAVAIQKMIAYEYEQRTLDIVSVAYKVIRLAEHVEVLLALELERRRDVR